MVEVRIRGRGEQGVITTSDLLAMTAFTDGHHARAFPSFGSEYTGAPVIAFCRIAETEIHTREPILEPGVVAVWDLTLLSVMDVFVDLKPEGYTLLDPARSFEELDLSELVNRLPKGHAITLPTFDPAREYVGRPVPNTVMLGGITALIGFIRLQSVTDAIHHRFPGKVGDTSVSAATVVYNLVTAECGRVDSKENADV